MKMLSEFILLSALAGLALSAHEVDAAEGSFPLKAVPKFTHPQEITNPYLPSGTPQGGG